MTRRESREHIIKLLFLRDFHDREELDEQNEYYFELFSTIDGEDKAVILKKYDDVVARLGEIDAVLSSVSSGWRLNRIGKIELNILRLAVYEMRWDDEVPPKVSINEAVEIAKTFAGDSSFGFINGILAKVVQT